MSDEPQGGIKFRRRGFVAEARCDRNASAGHIGAFHSLGRGEWQRQMSAAGIEIGSAVPAFTSTTVAARLTVRKNDPRGGMPCFIEIWFTPLA